MDRHLVIHSMSQFQRIEAVIQARVFTLGGDFLFTSGVSLTFFYYGTFNI